MLTKHRWVVALRRWHQQVDVGLCDPWLLGSAIGLGVFGYLMVVSASWEVAQHQLGHPSYFMVRQGCYVLAGLGVAYVVLRTPMVWWRRWIPWLLLVACGLSLCLWVPGLGRRVNGSLRWLKLGPLTLQVCEVLKWSVFLWVADYIDRRHAELQSQLVWFFKAWLPVLVASVLLLLQPDFGATVVLGVVVFTMLWLADVPWVAFVVCGVGGALGVVGLIVSAPYRMARLASFLHPWHDPYASGYQLTQALIAFGRGGVMGVGIGHGLQKLFYLPEAHTDFLFAVLVEETGLWGGMAVVLGFALLVARGLLIGRIAWEQRDRFGGALAYGLSVWLAIQAFFNTGVNMGLLPTKGLTLPLMSYGGTSLVMSCVAVAMIARVGWEHASLPSHVVGPPGVPTRRSWQPQRSGAKRAL